MLRTAILLIATVAIAGCSASANPDRKVIYGVTADGHALYRKASAPPPRGSIPLMCLPSGPKDGCSPDAGPYALREEDQR